MDSYGFSLISIDFHEFVANWVLTVAGWQVSLFCFWSQSDENWKKEWKSRVLLDRSHLGEASGPNESSGGPYLVVVFWLWDKKQQISTCQPATVRTQSTEYQRSLLQGKPDGVCCHSRDVHCLQNLIFECENQLILFFWAELVQIILVEFDSVRLRTFLIWYCTVLRGIRCG